MSIIEFLTIVSVGIVVGVLLDMFACARGWW